MASMDTDSMHLHVDEQNVIIGQYDNGARFYVLHSGLIGD